MERRVPPTDTEHGRRKEEKEGVLSRHRTSLLFSTAPSHVTLADLIVKKKKKDCHLSFRCNALFLSGYRQWQRTGLYRWRSTLLSIGVSPSVVPFPRVIPNRVGDRLRSCSLSQTIHSQTQGAIKRDPSSPFFFLLLFFIPFLLPCPPYRYSPQPLHPFTPVHIHSLLPTIDCIQLSPLTAVPPIAQIIRNLTLIPTLHNKTLPT
ncbi:hypothetical protein K457DRAFT_319175 [Linnemannia elongata AG-77]|uniref:Uncharacterized protein n=1 Tax=Linnemannia elongata AG-77 TaxID=1314771 RepID=A0A197K3A6_9FUNG|nr:hypothetical protein K457DRAFT_319175 [Linnemannia elongata AG-77]